MNLYVLDILNNGAPIDQINHTHVVLIPKRKHASLLEITDR